MATDIREFIYTKGSEVTRRKVIALNESSTSLYALDLSKLTPDQVAEATKVLENHVTGAIRTKGKKAEPIEGYKVEWNRAWRNFTKSKMSAIPEETETTSGETEA